MGASLTQVTYLAPWAFEFETLDRNQGEGLDLVLRQQHTLAPTKPPLIAENAS